MWRACEMKEINIFFTNFTFESVHFTLLSKQGWILRREACLVEILRLTTVLNESWNYGPPLPSSKSDCEWRTGAWVLGLPLWAKSSKAAVLPSCPHGAGWCCKECWRDPPLHNDAFRLASDETSPAVLNQPLSVPQPSPKKIQSWDLQYIGCM